MASAFAVGASDLAPPYRRGGALWSRPGNFDSFYSWTDTGPCVALFSPGVDVLSGVETHVATKRLIQT